MRKIFRIIKYLFLFILFIVSVWILSSIPSIIIFPQILSAFYVKEFCSCYYVIGQNESFCHNYSRQYLPLEEFQHDKSTKRVIATAFGVTNSARFVNKESGCVLEPQFSITRDSNSPYVKRAFSFFFNE